MNTFREDNEMDIASGLSTTERLLSVAGGSYLLYNTISNKEKSVIKGAVAGYLMYRGISGYCPISESFGKAEVDRLGDIHIETHMTVDKPRNEVYDFWHDLENLPLFMEHLKSVKKIDNKLSEWTTKVPGQMGSVSWKSEIVEDEKGEALGWQSVDGSMIENTGTVRFRDADESGTEVSVIMSYRAPMGKVGEDIAKLLNPVFEKMVREDVQDFKQFVESGKVEPQRLKSNS
ncbi:MAG TPA: SRPBCC family protein [Balneolaceae bacterium]